MSELVNSVHGGRTNRLQLLSTVSAAALIVSITPALASDDADRPTVWIEFGGQLERTTLSQATFTPPFFSDASPDVIAPMADAQTWPRYSVGGEGKLTFAPQGSTWSFSAAVRYGRSNATRHLHHETSHELHPSTFLGRPGTGTGAFLFAFGDGQSQLGSSHTILDFHAGKDIGIGLFGSGSHSVVSAGLRYAQFGANSDVTLLARPVYRSGPNVVVKYHVRTLHDRYVQNNAAMLEADRSTHAVGPSVAWDVSIPIVGSEATSAIAVDWGANAALLFGRQRTRLRHQTGGAYYSGNAAARSQTAGLVSRYAHGPYDHDRNRTVTIPNVGGFAGVSFKYLDAKVSFGYRADFFFNAVDTGIDTEKSSTLGFYGPFATVSIGLGG